MTDTVDLINDEQRLVSAKRTRSVHAIQTYDDGFGPLWISQCSIGILGIVRARTWEDAYSICEDEFFPEADETVEQLVKEYGFRREHRKVVRDASVTAASGHIAAGERFEVFPDDYPDGKLAPAFIRWVTIETPDANAWTENELFCEAYGFRNNGPNEYDIHKHGIYQKDLNGDSLDRLTAEMLREMEIELTMRTSRNNA
jgi:hypothetical protein